MSLFRRFLNPKSKSDKKQESPEKAERGKYMPEVKLPTDERFMLNFKNNGGKFLYCEDNKEMQEAFDNILLENDWYEKECFCLDPNLQDKFKGFNLSFTRSGSAPFFLSTCEYLVANDGSVIISSTSQLIDTIGEGLRGIKFRNKQRIPSNITTIKNFETQKEGDFMSYGSSTKNLYLLLLEDL
jgi:hypothetical protein